MRSHNFFDMPPACVDIFQMGLLRASWLLYQQTKGGPYNVDEVPPIEGNSTTPSRTRVYQQWCLSGPYKWLIFLFKCRLDRCLRSFLAYFDSGLQW